MFSKKRELFRGREATVLCGLGDISLSDTLECGQAFRYELTVREEGYVEYVTVVKDRLLTVGQREAGELIFYGIDGKTLDEVAIPYFSLDTDYRAIRAEVTSLCPVPWLHEAAEAAKGIVILRQEPWEALFSFIVSQNNNIPRIRKIIRKICAEYGECIALRDGLKACPLDGKKCPSEEVCRACGACYTFPTAEDVAARPEGLIPANTGFRLKYLRGAAESVAEGKTDLRDIALHSSYEYTLEKLKELKGVGDKVASCVALFGFGNLEAFPVDVWMKRAIDEYFDGELDPKALGRYAGVAQQYIFHYARNLQNKEE